MEEDLFLLGLEKPLKSVKNGPLVGAPVSSSLSLSIASGLKHNSTFLEFFFKILSWTTNSLPTGLVEKGLDLPTSGHKFELSWHLGSMCHPPCSLESLVFKMDNYPYLRLG